MRYIVLIINLTSLFLFFNSNSYASIMTVTCNNPSGTRVDYFTQNNTGNKNHVFIENKDSINEQDIITWDTSKSEAQLTVIGKSKLLSSNEQTRTIVLHGIKQSTEQITFVGMFDGAPTMYSLYPLSKIVIYSEHSIWPELMANGSRAIMFYSKCDFSVT